MITAFRRLQARCAVLLMTAALCITPLSASAALKVTFLSPDPPDNPFWGDVMRFMQAVADDLGIELTIKVSNGGSSYALKRDGLKILEGPDKPDYFVSGYWTGASDKFFETGLPKGIKFFVFNTNISDSERLKVDKPRVRFPNWIGHMMPDDYRGGHDLASVLIEKARALPDAQGPAVQMAGLGGTDDSSVAADRNAGLQKKTSSDANVHLHEVINTNWYRPNAEKATAEILARYPGTNAIWTAADALALGAIDVLKQNGRKPGKDIVVGGFDWSDEAIAAVQHGEMAATMGGHFMEGGWTLILIYDYHNGIDFAADTGESMVTPMTAITAENVATYMKKLGDQNWSKIDFRQFSKKYNPSLKKYSFSLDALLENIK